MQLCRQDGFIFICEILLVLSCESCPSNLHCYSTTSHTDYSQGALNVAGKAVLMVLVETTKGNVNTSFIPLFSTKNTSQSVLKGKWEIFEDVLSFTAAVWI